jgi:BirA family biotin operon repressor/biotin-[acetyl-CoA-carboxylase] ligase
VLSEDTIRRALLHAEIPDAPVRYEEVVDSTNSVAMAMARGGAPEWTVVAAGHQTAGRGRLGRRWESEPGRALQLSFVLRPELGPEEAAVLTLMAGAAMVDAAADVGVPNVSCKWPNDLLVGEAKAGGILTEAVVSGTRVEAVVVGVGVNLSGAPGGVEGAGALGDVEPSELVARFFRKFSSGYSRRRLHSFRREVVAGYRRVCATLGRPVRATTVEGRTVEGRAVDLDDDGNLVVERDGELLTVRFGEIHHLR